MIDLGLVCYKLKTVALIAPLRLDARLFEPAPVRKPGTNGRPRVVGFRLPLLRDLATDYNQEWELSELEWYGGTKREMYLLTGTAVWYSTLWADAPLPVRWVLVRDPTVKLQTKAFFSTDLCQSAASIAGDFVKRWNIEVTFEETRAHLGIETQRQWSDKAIERTTPVLLGLFSLVCLFAQALQPDSKLEVYQTAWYRKTEATFSDVLATVRRALWGIGFKTSTHTADVCLVRQDLLERLTYAACY